MRNRRKCSIMRFSFRRHVVAGRKKQRKKGRLKMGKTVKKGGSVKKVAAKKASPAKKGGCK